MAKCVICGVNPREIPDRNAQGRPIKKICRRCHANRLLGDLLRIRLLASPDPDAVNSTEDHED